MTPQEKVSLSAAYVLSTKKDETETCAGSVSELLLL